MRSVLVTLGLAVAGLGFVAVVVFVAAVLALAEDELADSLADTGHAPRGGRHRRTGGVS